MSKKDYYQILGVNRSSTDDEIKKAYRKLAMQHHPDKNPGNKKAEEKFKEISGAYDILSDPKKKKNYDQFGSEDGSPFSSQNSGGNPFGRRQSTNINPDSFSDLFGDIFGGGQNSPFENSSFGGRQRAPQRGADLRYTLTVTLEEIFTGLEKVITFTRQKNNKEENTKLSVTVPAGVKEGQRLKLSNEGDSPVGGIPGDLYVIINLQNHLLFKREEHDLILDLPIPYTDAILGLEIEIPTLTGKSQIRIPAGTSSGQTLRLKNKGFPKLGSTGQGDMLVRIIVDVPSTISAQQRKFIEDLQLIKDETPLVKAYNEKLTNLLKNR